MMHFQPYLRFLPRHIGILLKEGKQYLVSQSYPRGNTDENNLKYPIIFSPYKELHFAQSHNFFIAKNKYASIIHLTNSKHRQTVESMCLEDSRYLPFIALVPRIGEVNNQIKKYYSEPILKYVKQNIWWKVGHTGVETEFITKYGEPYVLVKWGSQRLEAKLDDIEKV